MEPSRSPEPLGDDDVGVLLDLADAAIVRALRGEAPMLPALDALPPALRAAAGAFVTLKVRGELNGCVGTVERDEPLGVAVPRLALSAAFSDYRLPPLQPRDRDDLTIELSVLTPLVPMAATSRDELLAELVPHHDGLLIRAGARQAVFLPKVWDDLPAPDDFLDHLWRKAGLPFRAWPREMETFRFAARTYARAIAAR